MKTKIRTHYPQQIINDFSSDIYIVDYTEQTKNEIIKKGVEIRTEKPKDIRSFFIKNGKSILFSSIIFDNKSFIDETTGNTLTQCECVCFSSAEYSKGPWVLFLELKYCNQYSKYQKENLEEAKNQLIDTYKYYKQKGIINNKQQCYLVVSFPFFQIPFPNFVDTQDVVKKMRLNKVIFRGLNELIIRNEYKLEV